MNVLLANLSDASINRGECPSLKLVARSNAEERTIAFEGFAWVFPRDTRYPKAETTAFVLPSSWIVPRCGISRATDPRPSGSAVVRFQLVVSRFQSLQTVPRSIERCDSDQRNASVIERSSGVSCRSIAVL